MGVEVGYYFLLTMVVLMQHMRMSHHRCWIKKPQRTKWNQPLTRQKRNNWTHRIQSNAIHTNSLQPVLAFLYDLKYGIYLELWITLPTGALWSGRQYPQPTSWWCCQSKTTLTITLSALTSTSLHLPTPDPCPLLLCRPSAAPGQMLQNYLCSRSLWMFWYSRIFIKITWVGLWRWNEMGELDHGTF